MAFLFGSSDLSTPIGQVVKAATDPLLIRPDWEKNMEICEMVNSTADGCDQVLKAISRRLQDSDQNTVYLAIVVAESCMKNVGIKFAGVITKGFMDLLIGLARGSKGSNNSNEALRVIQEWGREFEERRGAYPIFFDTYMTLRSRGFVFPPEKSRPVAQQTNSKSNSSSAPAPAPAVMQSQPTSFEEYTPSSENDMERLRADLGVVTEKVKLCRQMLFQTVGIRQDELLAEIVGFLEACRDRMVDLIEAGTQGMLGEVLFAECLKVNDTILRTLEAEKNGKPIDVDDDGTEKALTAEESKDEAGSPGNLLDLGETPPKPAAKPPPTLLSAAEDDIFGSMPMTAAVPAKAPQKKQQMPIPGQNGAPLIAPTTTAATTTAPTAAIAVPTTGAFDPFGNAPTSNPFDAPMPIPPVVQAQAPQQSTVSFSSSTNNPFDPFAIAAPPGVHGSGNDDLDFLSAGSTGAAPAPAPASSTAANTNEFDDFFDSLK